MHNETIVMGWVDYSGKKIFLMFKNTVWCRIIKEQGENREFPEVCLSY